MTKKDKVAFDCPVDAALQLIRGKWKPMILWQLTTRNRRFKDLQSAMPRVAHKVLTEQLRQLQTDGMIRSTKAVERAAAYYEMTDFGRTLRPALNALAAWGKCHQARLRRYQGAGL
jgi:DNA-binding HxlR family transcriptional regulator